VDPGPASCLFVSDLHGSESRYEKLWAAIAGERPAAVFLGGDLLPHFGHAGPERDFVDRCLAPGFAALRARLGDAYPSVFLILGNDDPRAVEPSIVAQADGGLWAYAHQRRFDLPGGFSVYGYAFVPPTPFLLKDWERYDVSRYVDPGCVSPEEGRRSVDVPLHEIRNATIRDDLERLAGEADLGRAVFLFHSPPYDTLLDRAALDGRSHDHVPLDVHVGSIAIRRFIEARRPRLTLHGHIHESARLTGGFMERIGATVALSAAHDGPELAVVTFDLEDPGGATRTLV
jgi:Icc-related predicted phosphoesterase